MQNTKFNLTPSYPIPTNGAGAGGLAGGLAGKNEKYLLIQNAPSMGNREVPTTTSTLFTLTLVL